MTSSTVRGAWLHCQKIRKRRTRWTKKRSKPTEKSSWKKKRKDKMRVNTKRPRRNTLAAWIRAIESAWTAEKQFDCGGENSSGTISRRVAGRFNVTAT